MTPYQQRMSRFVTVGSTYAWAVPIALYFFDAGRVGWYIWASTCVLLYALAIGLDAVHDSLIGRLQQPHPTEEASNDA